MTATASFALVPFHDHQVLAARTGDKVFVPLKRFCATIGLPWDGQRQRLQRDEILAKGASIMLVPSDGGDQEQLCLPIELIPGFLFSATTSKYAPELRERVQLFRAECYRVLHEHFFGGGARAITAGTDDRAFVRIIAALKAEPIPEVRRSLHQLLTAICRRLGIDTPPAEVIITPATVEVQRHRATIDLFWERYALLEQGEGRSLNHHRKPGLIAVSLVEYEQRCADARLRCPPLTELRAALRFSEHPRFIEAGTVNSQHGATMHCWIFADESAQPTLFPEPSTSA